MFEGKPPQPADVRPLEIEAPDGAALRPLRWDDLVARLSAARELRNGLLPSGASSAGSFDAGSARLVAAHHNGKHPVNPDDSSNGKDSAGTALRVHQAGPGVVSDAARE